MKALALKSLKVYGTVRQVRRFSGWKQQSETGRWKNPLKRVAVKSRPRRMDFDRLNRRTRFGYARELRWDISHHQQCQECKHGERSMEPVDSLSGDAQISIERHTLLVRDDSTPIRVG